MTAHTPQTPTTWSAVDVDAVAERISTIDKTIRVPSTRIILGLSIAATFLLVLDLIVQTIHFRLEPDYLIWPHVVRFFDLNAESSLPTWFAGMLLALAALLTLCIAIVLLRAGDHFARHWLLLALLVTGFSIDESAQIHDTPGSEPLRDLVGASGILHYAWVVPAMLSIVVFGFIFLRFLLALPRRTRAFFMLSALVFVSGAIGLEMLGGWYTDSHPEPDLTSQTISSFEEFFELSGVILLLAGLLDYANLYVGEIRLQWLPVRFPTGK